MEHSSHKKFWDYLKVKPVSFKISSKHLSSIFEVISMALRYKLPKVFLPFPIIWPEICFCFIFSTLLTYYFTVSISDSFYKVLIIMDWYSDRFAKTVHYFFDIIQKKFRTMDTFFLERNNFCNNIATYLTALPRRDHDVFKHTFIFKIPFCEKNENQFRKNLQAYWKP